MTHDEFKDQLDELQKVMINVLTHYTVWLEMWPTEDIVDTLNHFKGFFFPVRSALLSMMVLECVKLFDRYSKTISLTNLLSEAKDAPSELVPHAEHGALERLSEQISGLEQTLETLKRIRNQEIGHLDANPKGGEGPTLGEMENFLNVIQSVFNGLALANDRQTYHWGNLEQSAKTDTSDVLRVLKERIEQDREARRLALEARRLARSIGRA